MRDRISRGPIMPPSTPPAQAMQAAAASLVPAPDTIRFSSVLQDAGAKSIGDWLLGQSKALPKEQQAMVKSMLAHMESMLAGEEITQNSDRIGFRFRHTYESGSEPADRMALGFVSDNASYLHGELTVKGDGEVTGISIRDPAIGGQPEEAVDLKKPVPLCHQPSSGAAMRKRTLAEVPSSPAGSPSKRQARSPKTSYTLKTKYVDVGLTEEAQRAFEALGCGITLPAFYKKLRESNGGNEKKWRRNVSRVLEGFEKFIQEQGRKVPDIVANFGEFAMISVAYQKANQDAQRAHTNGALTDKDVRDALHYFCTLSFGERPLDRHVESKMKDPQSLLHDLLQFSGKNTEGKYRFEENNIYLFELHCAARGSDSAEEVFSKKDGFIETMSEVLDLQPGNSSLKHFLSYLLVDTFDAALGKAVLQAVACHLEKRRTADMALTDNAMRGHRRTAVRLAGYACAKQMSYESFLELLKKPENSPEIKDAKEWTGSKTPRSNNSRQFGATVTVLKKHLPPRLPAPGSAELQAAHRA